jgi:branched-chain amino acid transport system permease protein
MTDIVSHPARKSAFSVPRAFLSAAGLVILTAPFFGNDYHVTLAVNLCITLILTLSLNLVVGYSGQYHLSHTAFFGLGAYTSAILTKSVGLSPWLSLPLSVALVSGLAFIVGIPVGRLKGLYLAVATLAFSLFVEVVINQGGTLTGGGYGIQDIPALSLFGTPLRGRYFYPLAVLFLIIVGFALYNLVYSKFGREISAVRDHADAAAAAGIHPPAVRVTVLVLAAGFAAAAGWLHCFYHLSLNATLLSPELTFVWFFMVLVGGIGNARGVVLGTILLSLLPEFFGVATGQTILGIGVLMIVVTLFAPRGLGGILDDLTARMRGGRS